MIDSFIIAFSTYSRLPMPKADWNEKSMKYAMCFFSLVGAVIAIAELFVWWLALKLQTYNTITAFFLVLVPVAITGGIHLDGLFDTEDALHSYGDREKKLAILKDPHVGAFAVIYGVMYILGGYSLATEMDIEALLSVCFGFVISRELSGISVVSFPKAKKDGMVSTFSENADRKVKNILLSELILTVVCMFTVFIYGKIGIVYPAVTLAAAAVSFFRYRYRIVPEFGGTTGDLCGYFLCNCEFLILLANILTMKILDLMVFP